MLNWDGVICFLIAYELYENSTYFLFLLLIVDAIVLLEIFTFEHNFPLSQSKFIQFMSSKWEISWFVSAWTNNTFINLYINQFGTTIFATSCWMKVVSQSVVFFSLISIQIDFNETNPNRHLLQFKTRTNHSSISPWDYSMIEHIFCFCFSRSFLFYFNYTILINQLPILSVQMLYVFFSASIKNCANNDGKKWFVIWKKEFNIAEQHEIRRNK